MNQFQQTARFSLSSKWPLLLGGFATILLGTTVMVGWLTHLQTLIQIHPDFVPMQFNTALGFVLCGLGTLLYAFKKHLLTKITAIILALLSALTLFQYIAGINLGIDELFLKHYIYTKSYYPGRMSPNTAISFLCTSIILVSFYIKNSNTKSRIYWTLTPFLFSLGLVSLVGYITKTEVTFSWQKYTQMAVHTSLGFVMLSASFLFFSIKKIYRDLTRIWLPFPAFFMVLLCFTLFSFSLKQKEYNSFHDTAKLQSDLFQNEISIFFDEALTAFKRMGSRLTYPQSPNFDFWRKDAREYRQDFLFYQAIQIADTSANIILTEPLNSNGLEYHKELHQEIAIKSFFQQARNSQELVVSDAVRLIQGGTGCLLIYPVFKENAPMGFLVGIVKINALFEKIHNRMNSPYLNFLIYNKNKVLFSSDGTKLLPIPIIFNYPLKGFGTNWKMSTIPTSNELNKSQTLVPEVTLGLGLLVSLIVSFLVYLGQKNFQIKQRYDLLINGIGVGVWDWISVDDIEEYWSPNFYKLLGYQNQEIKPNLNNFSTLLHPNDKEKTFSLVEQHFKNNVPFDLEYRLKTKEKGYRWFKGKGIALRNHLNKPVRMIGSIEDIHETKVLQEEVNKQNQLMQLVFENMQEGITVFSKDFKPLIFNKAGKFLTGMDDHKANPAEWPDQFGTFKEDQTTKYQDTEFPVIKALNGKVIANEIMYLKNHNKPQGIFISCSASPIYDTSGEIIASLILYRDISIERQFKEQIQEKNKQLEKVNEELEQFTYVVSHDLKAPLVSIDGFSSRLEQSLPNASDKQLRYLSRIKVNVRTMGTLLTDLLTLSRSKQMDYNLQPVELKQIIKQVMAQLEIQIKNTRTKIEIKDLPTVTGDPDKLTQVFTNIVGNAIKYCKPDTTPRISLTSIDHPDHSEIIIKDNGLGIAPEYQEKVFKVFERINPEEHEGTGVGLSIVKSIIEKHKGKIWVVSNPGEGSAFHFTLKKDL